MTYLERMQKAWRQEFAGLAIKLIESRTLLVQTPEFTQAITGPLGEQRIAA